MKRIAVVSDATSPEFFFLRWKKYYGNLFGIENLYLLVYQGDLRKFARIELPNIRELNTKYDDQFRAKEISDEVTKLLEKYDVVIRCDIDEFIVPGRSFHGNVKDYIENNDFEYLTAKGIDVLERLDDAALNPELSILAQRSVGVRSAALNKTCITTVPLRWAAGFHAADVMPVFSSIYLFHLKFSDIKSRIAWHKEMLNNLEPETQEYKYFSANADFLTNHQRYLLGFERNETESEEEFDCKFLATVERNPINGICQGEFFVQKCLTKLAELASPAVAVF